MKSDTTANESRTRGDFQHRKSTGQRYAEKPVKASIFSQKHAQNRKKCGFWTLGKLARAVVEKKNLRQESHAGAPGRASKG
ncbi:hypothetical protein EDS67_14840 [candidate division KSB1 bacterium]|nr:MAG: hypothetical protein EDS67_14840 [candidate division KSB1 bacterium]MBC6952060.1 hypothetical protein [candidate division KSB1 bacterium]MCE7940950.1 hypothetical protein [Chlorobi bacterium CHB1]